MSRPKPSGRSYGRLTRHERNTVERMLDRNSSAPRDRRGARQVALDRDQGGCGAPLRHRAALALRRARARGPVGGLPQALRVAEVLQRLLAQEGLRLLEEAQGVLQRQEGAGGGRRRALGEQVRDRRDRGGRRRQARGHQGRARARALPAADSGDDPRAQRLHRLQVGGRRLRRHDEHGAQAHRSATGRGRAGPRGGRRRTRRAGRTRRSSRSARTPRAAAWEMDTVEGARGDSARLLTLLHRPSRFQLALPLPDGTCASVLAALSSLRGVLGEDGARRAFGAVLTDNGSEFADEGRHRGAARRAGRRDQALLLRPPGRASRRARARRTTSRSGSCCPRAPGSGSTG